MEKYNKTVGTAGEKAAVKYLKKKGYKIIDTNYFVRGGEIDIIAQKDGYVVFIEVKTRTSDKFGLPTEAVGYTKQQRIQNAARFYIMSNGEVDIRFDVIGVVCDVTSNKIRIIEIEHIENAFY